MVGGVGPAQSKYRKTRANCRQMIQDGLGKSIYDALGVLTNILLQRLFSKKSVVPAPV